MPATPGVQIEGMRRLRSTLKRAGADMADFTTINKQVAQIVVPVAVASTPIGPADRGHISRTVRGGGNRTAAIIRVGNNTTFPYANPLHWGWFRRNIRPNPWVSRAAQSTEGRWRPVMFAGLEAIIAKVKGA